MFIFTTLSTLISTCCLHHIWFLICIRTFSGLEQDFDYSSEETVSHALSIVHTITPNPYTGHQSCLHTNSTAGPCQMLTACTYALQMSFCVPQFSYLESKTWPQCINRSYIPSILVVPIHSTGPGVTSALPCLVLKHQNGKLYVRPFGEY